MNITWPTSQKRRDIVSGPQAADIDELVRQLYSDMNHQASAIGDYLVDVSRDVTGTMSPLRLGASDTPSTSKFYREDGSFAAVSLASLGGIPKQHDRVSAWNIVTDTAVSRDVGLASTSAGAVAAQKDAGGYWGRRTTAAAAGSSVNWTSTGSVIFWADHNPFVGFQFRTGASIVNLRLWFGIFTAAPTNADTITGRVLGFRYSTVAADPGFMTVLRDNVTTTVSAAAVASIAASTTYKCTINVTGNGTSVEFSVNGVTSTVSVPAGILGNDLWWGLYLFTTEAVAKVVDTKSLYYEHD